jgi:hypothetical protein
MPSVPKTGLVLLGENAAADQSFNPGTVGSNGGGFLVKLDLGNLTAAYIHRKKEQKFTKTLLSKRAICLFLRDNASSVGYKIVAIRKEPHPSNRCVHAVQVVGGRLPFEPAL